MTFSPTDLAVVIPTRDRWDVLARTLRGLRAQTVRGFSVLVVVDGEDQRVPDLGSGVRTLVKAHGGPGAARNAGIRAAQVPLVLLLGDDMIPAADLVERHLQQHRHRPEPHVCVLGRVDWHPDAGRNRIQRWLDWSRTQYDFDSIDDGVAGPGHFYSSNVSAKRAFLLDVGGFDEDFPFVYEDIDLGFRLAAKGMHLVFDDAARTRHLHRYQWRAMEGRFRAVGSGEYLMCRKHPHFAPYFLDRIRGRRRVAPGSAWPWLVDAVPGASGRLRRSAEARADSWYMKRLTTSFLTGWTAGAELDELRRYLGDDFDYPHLCGRSGPVDADADATGGRGGPSDVLYDRTVRVMAGHVTTVVDDLLTVAHGGARVLHHRCGTGSLGLQLLDAGASVTFSDVEGPALAYLRWRLEQRGRRAEVLALAPDADPSGGAPLLAGFPGDRFDLAVVDDLVDAAELEDVLATLATVAGAVAVVSAGPPHGLARLRRARLPVLERRRAGVATLVVYDGAGGRRARQRPARRRRRHGAPWPPVARG